MAASATSPASLPIPAERQPPTPPVSDVTDRVTTAVDSLRLPLAPVVRRERDPRPRGRPEREIARARGRRESSRLVVVVAPHRLHRLEGTREDVLFVIARLVVRNGHGANEGGTK